MSNEIKKSSNRYFIAPAGWARIANVEAIQQVINDSQANQIALFGEKLPKKANDILRLRSWVDERIEKTQCYLGNLELLSEILINETIEREKAKIQPHRARLALPPVVE